MAVEIVQCDDTDHAEWNAFVASCAAGSVYHRYEWRAVNRSAFGHPSVYLAAREGQRMVGVLPVVQVKSPLFGNIACSLPFVNYGGPCAESGAVERQLVDALKDVADRWRVEYVELRTRKAVENLPTAEHKVSMTIDLTADPDVLWKKFTSSHRQDIRAGYKRGLTVRVGGSELLPDFYTVLSESWRDMGTPIYSLRYLQTVAAAFEGATRLCVVYSGAEPASAAFDLLDGATAEGLWLGSRSKFRKQHAGYVLYWELIKDACERGFTRFHLGRSTVQSGGEMFKKKWNAYPTQLYWQYLLRTRRDIPQLNVDNPKYRYAIKAWQKLPVPITRFIGPMIARSIP